MSFNYHKEEGLIEHTASWWVNNFSNSLFVSNEWDVYDVIQWKASSQARNLNEKSIRER